MSQQISMMNGACAMSGVPYSGMLSFARIAHAAMPDTSRAIPVPDIVIAETKENLYTPYTPDFDGYLSIYGISGADSGTISVSRSQSIVDGEMLQSVSTDGFYRQGPFVPLLAGATYYIRTYNIKSISARFFPLMAYAMDGRWVEGA